MTKEVPITLSVSGDPQSGVLWQSRRNRATQKLRAGVVALAFVVIGLYGIPYAAAQEKEESAFQVGGLLFGDLYHVVSHHTEEGDGATGAVLRRGYLTFDADFSNKLFSRLRFELNQSGKLETYTFDVDFKDLYAGVKVGQHRVLIGLSPTLTFDLIESFWGLRYLARTPLDLQGVASRDAGVSAKGPLNTAGTLKYRIMVGSGLDFGNESGDGWKWMGALNWNPSPCWIFDLYADYETIPGPRDRTTFQIFAGYKTDNLRWGVQYSNQDRQEDPRLELASAFVVGRLGKRTALVGRIDRIMEPSPKGDNISYLPFDPSARATFLIGGVEFRITPYLTIIPNTIITIYDKNDQGIKPKTDFHLRLTVFINLEG